MRVDDVTGNISLLLPQGAKFQRQTLGIPFRKEVLGGLDDSEGRAWPEAAWNVYPVDRPHMGIEAWECRHALRDCSDTPLLLPFTPLGQFLEHEGPKVPSNAATAYITALQIAHTVGPGRFYPPRRRYAYEPCGSWHPMIWPEQYLLDPSTRTSQGSC